MVTRIFSVALVGILSFGIIPAVSHADIYGSADECKGITNPDEFRTCIRESKIRRRSNTTKRLNRRGGLSHKVRDECEVDGDTKSLRDCIMKRNMERRSLTKANRGVRRRVRARGEGIGIGIGTGEAIRDCKAQGLSNRECVRRMKADERRVGHIGVRTRRGLDRNEGTGQRLFRQRRNIRNAFAKDKEEAKKCRELKEASERRECLEAYIRDRLQR